VLLVAAVIGFGYYVYTQKHDAPAKPTAKTSATTRPTKPLTLDKTKLSKGWKVALQDVNASTSNIQLNDEKSGCFAGIFYTTDTAESNAPTEDHYQNLLDSEQSKGYQAEVSDTTLTIKTPEGTKSIAGKAAKVSNDKSAQYQEYSYISTEKYFVGVQRSCGDVANLPAARKAILAITVLYSE
jgi:hypothetical protein